MLFVFLLIGYIGAYVWKTIKKEAVVNDPDDLKRKLSLCLMVFLIVSVSWGYVFWYQKAFPDKW